MLKVSLYRQSYTCTYIKKYGELPRFLDATGLTLTIERMDHQHRQYALKICLHDAVVSVPDRAIKAYQETSGRRVPYQLKLADYEVGQVEDLLDRLLAR